MLHHPPRILQYDPRICLAVTGVLSFLLWRAPFPAILIYFTCIAAYLSRSSVRRRLPRRALSQSVSFCLVWALLKLGTDIVLLFISPDAGEIRAAESFLLPAATFLQYEFIPDAAWSYLYATEAASLFFLRLVSLLFFALGLSALCSAYQLGLAIAWFLRPLSPQKSWEAALAFALMIRYIPLIHQHYRQSLLTAEVRRLRLTGLKLKSWAISHTMTRLMMDGHKQAVALITRRLYTPEAWKQLPNPPVRQLAGGAIIIALANGLAIFSTDCLARWL